MQKYIGYLAGLLLLQYQAVAVAVPEVLTDGMGFTADFADYRIDTGGNLHLVWHDADEDGGAIMYMMFDSAGTTLIDRTQVNNIGTGNTHTRPAIEIDAASMLFVVWEDSTAREVRFMRLDPSQALQDGNSTTQALIKDLVIGEVVISAASGNNAANPRMRLDANGDLHVVWESTSGGTVQYAKVNAADGTYLNGPLSLAGGTASGADLPDVDVDTAGNAHVVYTNVAPINGENQIYYAMIDGDPAANPAVPIAPTVLSADDILRAGSATVNVDRFDDTLYIVFKQALMPGILDVEEIFLARLNPALAAQDGLMADPAVLKLFERQITNGEGLLQWQVKSRIGGDKRIHATYIDFDGGNCLGGVHPPYSITDAHITFAGTVITRDVLTTTGSATTCAPQARGAPGLNRIVWTDITSGTREILSSVFSRAVAGSSGFSCSLRNQNTTGWTAADLWLLLGAIAGLGLWRKRKAHIHYSS